MSFKTMFQKLAFDKQYETPCIKKNNFNNIICKKKAANFIVVISDNRCPQQNPTRTHYQFENIINTFLIKCDLSLKFINAILKTRGSIFGN